MISNINIKKTIITKVFYSVISLLYIYIFIEVFLRIFSPTPILPRYIEASDYGIRKNIGGISYTHVSPEYKIEIRTNSSGIRSDKEISYINHDNKKRVVVLGDSFAMGYGVNIEDSYTNQMLEELKKVTDDSYEVVNLASSGHGNAEELIVLQNRGVLYDPDIVLLSWHITDLNDNVRSNLFGLSNEGNIERVADSYLPGVAMREKLFNIPLYEFFATKSHFYNRLRDLVGTLYKRILVTKNTDTEIEIEAETSIKDKERLCYELLYEINKICESIDAQFIILDIPVKKTRTEYISFFPDSIKKDLPSNIKYYSPIDDFNKIANPDLKLYWEKSHGHFTPTACEIVGKGLAELISEEN